MSEQVLIFLASVQRVIQGLNLGQVYREAAGMNACAKAKLARTISYVQN